MTRHAVALIVWLQAAVAVAGAQGVALAPSFGTSTTYDDNLFQRSAADGDLSVRFSPRLDVGRQTETLTWSGHLALNADRFTQHPELTTALAREDTALDVRYAASRRLSITTAASFTETETPADLNDVTALTPGRMRARRIAIHPAVSYSLGPRADAAVAYTATSDTLHGGVGAATQTATMSLGRHVSARTRVGVEYVEQHFLFDGSQASASRAIATEWTRDVSHGTTLILRAGPRLTGGVLAPELLATARRVQRAASYSVSYQRTQTTLVGLAGIADIQSVTATAERALSPRVLLLASSGVLQARQAGGASLTYRVSGGCRWALSTDLSLEAGYDADRQRGNLYTGEPAQYVRRNRAMLSLVVSPAPAMGSRR